MSDSEPIIERLTAPYADADLSDLAQILADAVERGAAVSFVHPLAHADAKAWWVRTLESMSPRSSVLVARMQGRVVGTVQLHPSWAPNQPHRADVAKLLVSSKYQRLGLGARLMTALEVAAREAEVTLLTLDAKAGSAAERLYRRLGWTAVGTVPGFARDPHGPLHDAIIMYKALPQEHR